jgi:hypothetical protein
MYGLVGPRTGDRWDACADAYANAAGELAGYAADRNVTLAIEPTSWLYADLTFVHSFHDATLVAPGRAWGSAWTPSMCGPSPACARRSASTPASSRTCS